MSLSVTTLAELQNLMAKTPALLGKLQGTNDATQAAAVIAAAAVQKGIAVSTEELSAYFEKMSQSAANQALSDQQLEAVAGGAVGLIDDALITISIFTLGIGCAIVSIGQSAGDKMGFKNKRC